MGRLEVWVDGVGENPRLYRVLDGGRESAGWDPGPRRTQVYTLQLILNSEVMFGNSDSLETASLINVSKKASEPMFVTLRTSLNLTCALKQWRSVPCGRLSWRSGPIRARSPSTGLGARQLGAVCEGITGVPCRPVSGASLWSVTSVIEGPNAPISSPRERSPSCSKG